MKIQIFLIALLLTTTVALAQNGANFAGSADAHPDTLFTRMADQLVREANVVQKEAMYQEMIKAYPAEGNEFRSTRYRYLRMSLGLFWSSRGNREKGLEYYNMLKKDLGVGMAVAYASNFVRHKYYKDAITILDDWMHELENPDKSTMYTFQQASDAYAVSQFQLGKKEEALATIMKAYEKSDKKIIQTNSTLVLILNSLGKHKQALPIMEDLLRDGMASDEVKELYKDSYLKNKGHFTAFTRNMEKFQKDLNKKMQEEAVKKLVNEPSFAFKLRDNKGSEVALADLAGKVVVLDFWATWCGPCIKSMPAMQKAANHYKDDEKVQFLFIDTGEKIPDFESAVKKLLDDNNYDFHVLFDERDPATGKCPVATGYKITGIPTKLIIDGNGRLRYRLIGYNGGIDATVAELIAMIENVK